MSWEPDTPTPVASRTSEPTHNFHYGSIVMHRPMDSTSLTRRQTPVYNRLLDQIIQSTLVIEILDTFLEVVVFGVCRVLTCSVQPHVYYFVGSFCLAASLFGTNLFQHSPTKAPHPPLHALPLAICIVPPSHVLLPAAALFNCFTRVHPHITRDVRNGASRPHPSARRQVKDSHHFDCFKPISPLQDTCQCSNAAI